jgi:hypothetical protein
MVGIQNSILVLDSSKGFRIHESLKGTNPQNIAVDPLNPDRGYCGNIRCDITTVYHFAAVTRSK